jgi:N-acetyltransferase
MEALVGSTITLLPMSREHADALAEVGLEPKLWALQPRAIRTLCDMRAYVEEALALREKGESLPYVIAVNASSRIVGSTRLFDIARAHRRAEIGATWITPAYQRTSVNTEAKLLLLTFAFESMGMQKVVFKTELLNEQSQRAIERLGAAREGVFRKHLIADDGRVRDMVYYAIFDTDWPRLKERLVDQIRGPLTNGLPRS